MNTKNDKKVLIKENENIKKNNNILSKNNKIKCKIQEILNDKIIINLYGFRIALKNKGFTINNFIEVIFDKNNNIIDYKKVK